MRTESISIHGWRTADKEIPQNEDRIVCRSNLFAVIDGATSPVPLTKNGLTTAEYVAEWLSERLHQIEIRGTAGEILNQMQCEFSKHLECAWPEAFALGRSGPRAAAVLAVRQVEENTISWAAVADSVLLARKSGAWTQISEDSHWAHAERLLSLCLDGAKRTGINLREFFTTEEYRAVLKHHRDFPSVVFEAVPPVEPGFQSGVFNVSEGDQLLLCSDGFADPSCDSRNRFLSIARQTERRSLREIVSELRLVFDRDPDFDFLPRFKHMDDTSALLVTF